MIRECVKKRRGLPRTNKPVILPEQITWLKQPNAVTTMAYNFHIQEMKIFVAIIEKMQKPIEMALSGQSSNQLSFFETTDERIRVDIKYKDLGISHKRYSEVEGILKKMRNTSVEFRWTNPNTGEKICKLDGLISSAIVSESNYRKEFSVLIDRDVAIMMLDVNKGFTKYIKEIVTRAKSVYTMRIYMLVCSWKDKGGFSIKMENFRKMFCLENKYLEYKDLYKRVLKPAYEELFENSNYWFELAETWEDGKSEPSRLDFKVIRGVLSKEEEELLASHKKNIVLILERLNLRKKQIDEILPLITIHSIPKIMTKIVDLGNYIDTNIADITDIAEYVKISLLNEFESNSDSVKEEDSIESFL